MDLNPPPPAPPLPPQSRYGQRAATAIARFAHPFFAGPRAGTQRYGDSDKESRLQYDEKEATRSYKSKSEAVHKTGLPISAVHVSPDRTHAILAGREILKTIHVEDSTCTEDFNLRSKIINYAATHDSNRDAITAGHRDQLGAVDVKWSHGNFHTTIATAAANGRIMIYDLNKPSVEVARLHEHTRQVHRIVFNPHQPAFLLSGSQDGTIRLWDLRALGGGEKGGRSVKTCSSWKRYSANSDGIRDVKWSPDDGYTFAIGTENGSVQKWVLNKENAPVLRLHGHDRSCSAIDWHPNGRYLASASTEKIVKIWDFGSEDRRMKPINQIRTPQAVVHMQWRPNSSPNDANISDDSGPTTQITTSYDAKDPRIHVWDVQRPSVPIMELEKYDTPATSLVWHSRDLLWSVGQTGTFTQNDMTLAYKPSKRRGSAFAIGPDGRMAFFSSSRVKYRFAMQALEHYGDSKESYSEHETDQIRSNKDVSPEELAAERTIQKRRHRTAELRSNISFSSNASDDKAEKLESLKAQLIASFASPQLAAVGHVPQVCDIGAFIYLAENYKLPSYDFIVGRQFDPLKYMQVAFEDNACVAEAAGDIQLQQTWRILAHAVNAELQRVAEINKKGSRAAGKDQSVNSRSRLHNKSLDIKPNTVSGIGAAMKAEGSTMSTPIARPSQDPSMLHTSVTESFSLSATSRSSDSSSVVSQQQRHNDSVSSNVDFSKSAGQRSGDSSSYVNIPSISKENLSNSDLMVPFSSFPGLEEHLEESRNALSSYRARPRAVLSLDGPYGITQDTSNMAPLDRHDSNESFQMFSASVDSDHRTFPLEDSFDEKRSFSQVSNSSFTSSVQPTFSRTRLDDLREDDGQSTPLILEPQEALNHVDLPLIEKVNTQTTNDLVIQESIRRPSISKPFKIHKKDFGNDLQDDESQSRLRWSDYTSDKQSRTNPKPWSIYSILHPLIHYHSDILLNPQLPTVLSIWLWQFFPHEFNRAQITSLVLFYHRRLLSLELFDPAAQLRQCCALLFPEILDYTAGSTPAVLFCRNCNLALEANTASVNQTYCTRCNTLPAHCSICETDQVPPSFINTSHQASNLWSWCQGCGHGGHATCLSEWFSQFTISEGACAVLGCNHDCVSGVRREQVVAELERQKKKQRKSVVKDDWTVSESKAVEKARDIVATDVVGRKGGEGGVSRRGTASGRGNGLQGDSGGGKRVRMKVDGDDDVAATSGMKDT